MLMENNTVCLSEDEIAISLTNDSFSNQSNQSVAHQDNETFDCYFGEVRVDAKTVGILNGAKPLTQVILNPVFGVVIDK